MPPIDRSNDDCRYSVTNKASSFVDGCSEQQNGAATGAPGAMNTHSFHVGSRDNAGYDRCFKGDESCISNDELSIEFCI